MELKLKRTYEDGFTGGELLDDDGEHLMYTLEPSWLSNRKGESCVPAGRYALQYHKSPKYGNQWHLVNMDLNVSIDQDTVRDHILIHVGNWPKNTKGCILVGLVKGMGAVYDSRDALSKLHELLGEDNHVLEILV